MRTLAAILALGSALLAPPAVAQDDAAMLREIAEDAYIYAYPLVLMEMTRRVVTRLPQQSGMGAPMNVFAHRRSFPDDSFTAIVRPNADTLYSSLWFDVSSGPLVIDLPDSGGRYYLLHMMDMWTDTFAAPGARTTGTGPQRYAVVAPDWRGEVPVGAELIRSPTARGWILGRTQTNGAADFAAVAAFQDGWKAEALVPADRESAAATSPLGRPPALVDAMTAAEFFAAFTAATRLSPPHIADTPMLQRMRRIGIVPGTPVYWRAMDARTRTAIEGAWPPAKARILAAQRVSGVVQNGWRTNLSAIGSYGTDYLRRAMIAWYGLGANVPDDAVYPGISTDSEGRPLDAAYRYRIHFRIGEQPPVRAFWSLTMYDQRQLFAANAIRRFAIGDRDKLVTDHAGNMTLYIQREAPGGRRDDHWLPTPQNGPFSLTLRLYWPEKAALEGGWSPPPVVRVP